MPDENTPAGPPAASTVAGPGPDEGDLKRRLAEAEAGRRKAETRAAELEDENRSLKEAMKPAPAAPAAGSDPAQAVRDWLNGGFIIQ